MYREILQHPGLVRTYASNVVGKFPIGAIGLLLILRTNEQTGSYAAGGAVAGAFALTMGLGSPLLGRVIDRRGQAAVLIPAGLWSAATLTAFAALPDGTPVVWALVLAAAAGATTPPLSACQRAIWTETLEPHLRHGVYSLDAVIFELAYILAPLTLVGAIGAWSLQAAIVVAAAFTAGGTLAFAASRLSRDWRPKPRRHADPLGPLRGAGVRTLLLALTCFAVGIATTEIAMTAFAQRHDAPHAVGILLACWGIGSMTGGILAARSGPPADVPRRLAILLLVLAALQAPMLFAGDLLAMGIAIAVAGLALAPSLALVFQLLSEVAPAGTVTEAQTWAGSALGVGIAVGSTLGGWMVEHLGTTETLGVTVVTGVVVAAIVAARRVTLAPPVAA
jgi:MFS family permease